jgi:hypothetical protein
MRNFAFICNEATFTIVESMMSILGLSVVARDNLDKVKGRAKYEAGILVRINDNHTLLVGWFDKRYSLAQMAGWFEWKVMPGDVVDTTQKEWAHDWARIVRQIGNREHQPVLRPVKEAGRINSVASIPLPLP